MLYTRHPHLSRSDSNSATTAGTTVTSGGTANTYGTWTQIHAGLSYTAYYASFFPSATHATTSATRNAYFDIGIGVNSSSVQTLVPYLCGSNAVAYGTAVNNVNGQNTYFFPIVIPPNVPIWCRHQNTVASVAATVHFSAYGGATYADSVPRVQYYHPVGTIGTATTTGVAITPGTSGQGAWTQMIASSEKAYGGFLVSGLFAVDTTQQNGTYTVSVGVGGSGTEQTLADNVMMQTHNTSEVMIRSSNAVFAGAASGQRIVARAACSGTPDASMSVILLGMVI